MSPRVPGACLVLSALLMFAFFGVHPQYEDPRDDAGVFAAIQATGDGWRLAQTLRTASLLVLLIGLLPLVRHEASPTAGWLARGGYVVWAIGCIFLIGHSGLELAYLGLDTPAASDLRVMDGGLLAVTLPCIGIGAALTGLGLALGTLPTWLGAGLVVTGGICAVGGFAFTLSGDYAALGPAFMGQIGQTVWLLVMGAVLALRPPSPH